MIKLKSCKLVIKDEINIKFENLEVSTRRKIANKLKFMNPSARHMPAYKLGRWDGTIAFFGIGGTGYLAHLNVIIPILSEDGYDIEVDDRRNPVRFQFTEINEQFWADKGKTWPEGHELSGSPILLRDYQVETINKFLSSPHGVVESSTGSGKCRSYDSLLEIDVKNEMFLEYLKARA